MREVGAAHAGVREVRPRDLAAARVPDLGYGGHASRPLACGLLLLTALAHPADAQTTAPPVTIGGLLRTGVRFEPGDSERRDAFDLFDARLSLAGRIGIVFDYFLQGEFEDGPDEDTDRDLRLLDARLTLPIRPELNLSFGQFKAPFGHETLLDKGKIRFVERSLVNRALAPNRQVGMELFGETLEGRLTYRAGVFNGNGRTLDNDNNSFLYAGRVQYNTVGPIEFYEELVVQVGASLAFSRDSAVELGGGLDGSTPGSPGLPAGVSFASFRGDRFLLGLDLHASYHGWEVNGEYQRGELSPPGEEGEDLVAWGAYVEGLYTVRGAVEAVVRYDSLVPLGGPDRDFLLVGLNVLPGFHAKIGVQYAVGLDGSPAGPGLIDGQFALLTQMSF